MKIVSTKVEVGTNKSFIKLSIFIGVQRTSYLFFENKTNKFIGELMNLKWFI